MRLPVESANRTAHEKDAAPAFFLGKLRVHGDEQQEIPKFFSKSVIIVKVDRVDDLVRFFQYRVPQ